MLFSFTHYGIIFEITHIYLSMWIHTDILLLYYQKTQSAMIIPWIRNLLYSETCWDLPVDCCLMFHHVNQPYTLNISLLLYGDPYEISSFWYACQLHSFFIFVIKWIFLSYILSFSSAWCDLCLQSPRGIICCFLSLSTPPCAFACAGRRGGVIYYITFFQLTLLLSQGANKPHMWELWAGDM